MYKLTARFAERFVVHSASAGARVTDRYIRSNGRIAVMPHGNYASDYPAARPEARSSIRADFGIPTDATVAIAFGLVRPYKRILEVVEEFPIRTSGNIKLLVVGAAFDKDYSARIREAAAKRPDVYLHLESVPTENVRDFFAASDIAIINYAEAFSAAHYF